MIVKVLSEHPLEFLSLKGGCTGSSESTHVKMPHCWKSHATAQLYKHPLLGDVGCCLFQGGGSVIVCSLLLRLCGVLCSVFLFFKKSFCCRSTLATTSLMKRDIATFGLSEYDQELNYFKSGCHSQPVYKWLLYNTSWLFFCNVSFFQERKPKARF